MGKLSIFLLICFLAFRKESVGSHMMRNRCMCAPLFISNQWTRKNVGRISRKVMRRCASVSDNEAMFIDTQQIVDQEIKIQVLLNSIGKVTRSTPHWLKDQEILSISPSKLAQKQLEEIFPTAPTLFPTTEASEKFDTQYRNCILSSFDGMTLEEIISRGRSNTHPLRLQVVAIPKNAVFDLHAHAAVEMTVPLIGVIRERRCSDYLLPSGILQRTGEQMLMDVPGSNYSSEPSSQDLKQVVNSLASKTVFKDQGDRGTFIENSYGPGQVFVNEVGSVHQSYTGRDIGCLFFGLAANLHVPFLPGHFQQREGIQILEGL